MQHPMPLQSRNMMAHHGRLFRTAVAGLLALLMEMPVAAQDLPPDIPAICETVAIQAAKLANVPLSVLRAISLTETGRKYQGAFRPWPWTVNMEGKGMWFDTREQALAYAKENFERGARSFDVGCFQINYKWHHEAFTSIEQMFDPLANAVYAAEFLKSLFAEKGNWGAAAGAYHSRNAQYAKGYQARFETIRARFAELDDAPLPEVSPDLLALATAGVDPQVRSEVIRINTYPLLQAGGTGRMGSLVPQNAAAGLSLASASGQARSLFSPSSDIGDPAAEVAPAADTTDPPEVATAGTVPDSAQTFVNLSTIY